MTRNLLIFCLLSLVALSCTPEKEPDKMPSKKVVEEIKAGDNIRDIIRNPVNANEEIDTVNVAKLVFDELRYDFGTVDEGDIVRHKFKFTNKGGVPLIITNAKSTCGCTISDWPKEAIPPGKGGVIDVRFDTKNKTERQGKPITVTANTYPKDTYLQVLGFVNPKKQ